MMLAISSSTDNFAVGLSVALAGRELPAHVNIIIAVCNATGALLAAGFGSLLGSMAPAAAPMLAAIIFFYLGWEELTSWRSGEKASPLARSAADGLALRLALPMTLNNLAGGVAGGAVGIGPLQAFIAALLASYVMMDVGHRAGRGVGPWIERWIEPRIVAVIIFCAVALIQVQGALEGAATA